MQEGGAMFLGGESPYSPERRINTYFDIGLDSLSYDYPKFRGATGIEIDTSDLVASITNEAGMRSMVGTISQRDAVYGIAGMLSLRRNQLEKDVTSEYGAETWNSMHAEAKDFWTYVYFNTGEGKGKEILYKKGTDWWTTGSGSRTNPKSIERVYYNAARTAGGAKLLRESGVER